MPKPTTGPGRSTSTSRAAAARPLGPRPQRVPSDAKSPLRRKLELHSVQPLLLLHRTPRFILLAVVALATLAGLFAPPVWGGLVLLGIAAFASWMTALSWPALMTSGKVVRVAVLAVVALAAIWRLTGHS